MIGRRYLIAIFFVVTFTNHILQAQIRDDVINLPYLDVQRYHLGFEIGLHTQSLKIVNNGKTLFDGAHLYSEVVSNTPGFNVGIVGYLTLIPNLDLRLSPALYIGTRPITFTDGEKKIKTFETKSAFIHIPLVIKYSAIRQKNIRPYVIGGIFGAYQLGIDKQSAIRYKPYNFGLQVGIGVDFYFKYFKLCPELSFSYGLIDCLDHNRKDLYEDSRRKYTSSIDRMQSKMITLNLFFE